MRKVLLVFAVMFLSLQMFGQNYTHRIATVMSDDGFESTNYTYDSEELTKVVGVHVLADYEDGYEYIDSIFYDELGHLVKLEEHQLLDGQWIFPNYVDYTYNEMGLRATRKNYNDFGTGFELGGTYYYYYDENGNKTYWELEMAGMMFQKAEFTYNEQNLLACELGLMTDFMGGFENSYKIEYSYSEEGYITQVDDYYWNFGSWELLSTDKYEYDEVGNCKLYQVLSGNTVVSKHEYFYDESILAENVYYFENPESYYPEYPHRHNAVTLDKFYTTDANTGQLMYVCDYVYFYDEIVDAVEENEIVSNIYPNPVKDFVNIEVENAVSVQIVDALGRTIYSTADVDALVSIDMRDYTPGLYFVKLLTEDGVSVKKVMKD